MCEDILTEIYEKYYNDIYLYALSMCRNHHSAQEICSDTFFKAMVSYTDETVPIKPWLLRVCRNCAIDRWRKARKTDDRELDENLPICTEGPISQILKKEEHQQLYQAIRKLPQAYQEVLYLFYFNDMSGKEIAEITGRSTGSVRTLLYRARVQLKELLKEEL